MKTAVALLLLAWTSLCAGQDARLMTEFGNHSPAPGVEVELHSTGAKGMRITLAYTEKGRGGAVGTGRNESYPILPGRWAAQFNPPNELWVFNGRDQIQLYERTSPGFKSSSSSVVPALWDRLPSPLSGYARSVAGVGQSPAPPERIGTTAAFRELLLAYRWSWKNALGNVPDRECVFMEDGTFRHPNFVAKFAVKDINIVHLTRKGGERAILTFNADYTKFEAIDFQDHRITGERLGAVK